MQKGVGCGRTSAMRDWFSLSGIWSFTCYYDNLILDRFFYNWILCVECGPPNYFIVNNCLPNYLQLIIFFLHKSTLQTCIVEWLHVIRVHQSIGEAVSAHKSAKCALFIMWSFIDKIVALIVTLIVDLLHILKQFLIINLQNADLLSILSALF